MTDDLVKQICKTWVDAGQADECFWEDWPECPTKDVSLTPKMVLGRIEALEAVRLGQTYRYIGIDGKPVLARDLEDRAIVAEAKLAKAMNALGGWLNVYTHCTIEEGVCCCGDDMKNHTLAMDSNHMPLDHGAYIAESLAAHTETLITELKGENC